MAFHGPCREVGCPDRPVDKGRCKRHAYAVWYAANRDKRRRDKQEWVRANPEKIRAQRARHSKKYAARHRERARLWHDAFPDLSYRARLAGREWLPGQFVEHVIPTVVLEMDDGACGICGEDVDPFNFHVDHIIPLSRGGEHSYINTQIACPGCNGAKYNKVLEGTC